MGSLSNLKEREVAIEVARLYEFMSRVYFYSNETLPIIYSVLRFVNEAERTGTSAELATAYSSLAVVMGYAQLHGWAEAYVERGMAVARKVNEPSNIITVNVVTGVYKVMVGKWEEVRALALEAKEFCEQLGDYRQWGDSTLLMAESAFVSGDIEYSLKFEKILLEDAGRRHNPLQQGWALFGVASISIRRGKEAIAIPMLEEALQILEELPNLASSINTNGQLALAHFRLGNEAKALEYGSTVINLAADITPTVYSLHIGLSAIAQVYFELWERALQNPTGKVGAYIYKDHAEEAIRLLRNFRKMVPIGQPYLSYFEGWRQWLMGKHEKAIQTWYKGLEAARKYRTLYEEGLLRAKLGVALKDAPEQRREHFERAKQIFEEMGAVRELGSLEIPEVQ
jgi:tetratricopeptide (TPR) repeat protein